MTDANLSAIQGAALPGRSGAVLTEARLPNWSLGAIQNSWGNFPLERKFLLLAVLSVGMAMATLGYWIEQRVRAGWVQGMAETGALYMEGFLAPHVQDLLPSQALSRESQDKIDSLLQNTSLGKRVSIINIWDLQGNLLLSTDKTGLYKDNTKLPEQYFMPVLKRVMSGKYVANFDSGEHLSELNRRIFPHKYLEIYAPLHNYQTKQVVAVGEFYEFSNLARNEIRTIRMSIWALVLTAGVFLSAILYLIVLRARTIISAKQAQLEKNVARAAALAKRNTGLRRAADRARLNAVVLNEAYLARVGADIHDGAIQILTLMMLKLPRLRAPASMPAPSEAALALRRELEPLIRLAQAELRNLSAGLVLPEVNELSLGGTIELAIERHEQQTGTTVERQIGNLPVQASDAIRVCSYRVIQEALTNAFKHAEGNGQQVFAHLDQGMLEIVVADAGAPEGVIVSEETCTRIGLSGMEGRVRALRGSLVIDRLLSGGTRVTATLPLRP